MLPYASKHNVRLILVNARDIGPSTPYSEAELALILSKDPAENIQFMRGIIAEFASFVAWLVQHEKIPPFEEDKTGNKTGGISLFAWSAGNAIFIPFFAMADTIPSQIRTFIEPYLRSYVLYGKHPHSHDARSTYLMTTLTQIPPTTPSGGQTPLWRKFTAPFATPL